MLSGGVERTTAPGAMSTPSSPCSIACSVAGVLLNAMSILPANQYG